MPWKERKPMDLKKEFVDRATRGEAVTSLCREFGISRTTGHKWLKRFSAQGDEGLEERSRRPKATPLATAEDVVLAVLELRDKRPRWGPKTLKDVLKRRFQDATPGERTIARILRRADRVRARRKRRAPSVIDRAPCVQADAPNSVWTVDFKGWWRTKNGERCEPLTVRDANSRYLLAVKACRSTYEDVRAEFERLFQRHGVPDHIQCDNGTPFISVRSPAGLSRLSAWWMSLGIKLIRSRPGCPQDNGAHERMHVDLAADVQARPETDLDAQQRALGRWRHEFNNVRPHQSLDGKTPAEVYKVTAPRPPVQVMYPYPAHLEIKRVNLSGKLRIRGVSQFFSDSLAGHEVGVERLDPFRLRVWFQDLDLGIIEVTPDIDDSVFEDKKPQKNVNNNLSTKPKKARRARQLDHSNV